MTNEYTLILIPRTCVNLLRQKDFIDVIKYLGMARLSWIIHVDPKCNHKYSCKNNTQVDLTIVKEKAV